MARTCPNGHVNDDANRFCDQCGAPLPQNADAAAPAAAPAVGSPTSGIACPVCGQENMPGTAFCDNCGAALPPPQPTAEADSSAAAVSAEPVAAAEPVASGGPTVACPQCGTVNDAANRFCDNCGASLADQPPAADAAAVPVDSLSASAPAMTESTPLPTEGTTMPAPGAPDLVDATPSSAAAPPDLVAPEALPAATPTPEPSSAPAASAPSGADRQRLEETIATQRKLVEQLEQMQASFGPATPAAIRQGLDEARSNLAQTEAELAALPPEKPPVDPAEVARLEETIATQRKLVEQLEQMQASFGPATPAAIRQGLDEARSNLAQTEAELEQLTGGQAAAPAHPLPSALDVATQRADEIAQPAPSAQPEPAPSAPAQQSTPAPSPMDTQASVASEPLAPPAPVAAAPAPQPSAPAPAAPAPQQAIGPHFVTRDGKQITLPTGGEVVVGREDPISGIHPELDMTPFGGEAGGVSRRHAVLREQNGQWSVTDLDSTNYTRVDGNRLAPNTPTPIQNGARVQFGRIELEFRAS